MIGARYFIVSVPPAPFRRAIAAEPAAAKAATPPAALPAAPVIAAVPKPTPASSEPVVSQVGFVIGPRPAVFADKIPAATGSSLAFTVTNGTGRGGVFHIFFYKASVDFSKIRILREDREEIPAGSSVEIAPYLLRAGIYGLNVKTADNLQLMQRTWKVVTVD